MPLKRKAKDAFGITNNPGQTKSRATAPPVSAFAAARARAAQAITSSSNSADQHRSTSNEAVDQDSNDEKQLQEHLSHDAVDLLPPIQAQPDRSSDDMPFVARPAQQRRIDICLSTCTKRQISTITPGVVEVVLKPGQTATFIGEYDLEVLSGSINLCGASLRSGQQSRVYAYSTHAIPQIYCSNSQARIKVTSVPSLASKLERLSPLFRGISTASDLDVSHAFLETTSDDALQRSLMPVEFPKDHQLVLMKLAAQAEDTRGRIAVACVGGKSSGKSTLSRHICNKLLTRSSSQRCLYLDLDPGQPEFGPSGQIYLVEVLSPLFGPSYTHFAHKKSQSYRLISAQTIAATTFRDDPQHYIDCVRHLFNHHQLMTAKRSGDCPIIVNTCGWVNGVGARVLSDILELGVTDVVSLDADSALEHMIASKALRQYSLTKASSKPPTRTPAALRQMQTMAYFHSRVVRDDSPLPKIIDTSIASWRPWIVPYGKHAKPLTAVTSYGQLIQHEFLAEVFDGAIVAIVSTEDERVHVSSADADQSRSTTAVMPPHVPSLRGLDPRLSTYQGLALIRSIDTTAQEMHLITPLTTGEIAAFMQSTVVLVRGAFDSPDWAYLEDVYDNDNNSNDVERPWVGKREMVGVEEQSGDYDILPLHTK